MTIQQIASATIPAPDNKKVLTKANGVTRDIIKEVLDCYEDSRLQVQNFAPYLKGATVVETCKNIWAFWKQNIKYQVDEAGVQWIKTPAAVWATKFCDCKSFSVAVASCLHALGIKGKFRFTSYGSNKSIPTHVYVVAMQGGKEIIIDCVWNAFNSQKPYAKKWDYKMTQIFRLSGTEEQPGYSAPARISYAVGELNINPADHTTTEAEMELAIGLQHLELAQRHNRRSHAVGSTYDNAYQVDIEAHKAALGAIGLFKSKKKKLAIATKKNAAGKAVNKKQAKLLEKAGQVVAKRKVSLLKKVGNAITKVVKTPARLAAKSALPGSAPFFLYLFITDAKVLAAAPEAVKIKRAKAEQYRNQVVNKLQMPAKNFDSIVRNGIMSAFGMPPEQVIAKWMADANFKVGFISEALSSAAGMLKGLLGKFGENLAADAEQFSPTPEDWGAMTETPAVQQQAAVQQYNSYTPPVQPAGGGGYTYSNAGGGGGGADWNESAQDTGAWEQTESGWVNRATGETSLNKPQDLDEVVLTSQKPAPQEAGGGGMVLLALLGVGMLMSSKK